MEFKEVIQKRHSVRAYSNQAVPDDKINRILEAGRLAPTASNRQNVKLIVVKDAATRKALMEAANNQPHVGQAPLIIAAVATNPAAVMSCDVPMYAVDLGIVIEHMVLAATDEGLGTCWIGAFSQDKARKALGVPDKYKVVTILPVGYASGESIPRAKKPLAEIVSYEKFSE
jgi:nitroreductase